MNIENWIKDAPVVAIDTETTGLHWPVDRVFGVAVAVPVSLTDLLADPINATVSSAYFDIRINKQAYQVLRKLAPSLRHVVNHNIKFDAHMLANDKVMLPISRCDCSMIRACLIDEHLKSYSLDSLSERYLKQNKESEIYTELAKLFGGKATRGVQMQNLHRAPASVVEPYARRDAELALRLWAWQENEISKQDLRGVWALERDLFPHIFKTERQGIRVDLDVAQITAEKLSVQIERQQRDLDKLAGFSVNPNPSDSIMRLFKPEKRDDGHFYAIDGTRLEKTDGGKPSINADALERMVHPAAGMILKTRKMIKTRDTFINGHIIGHAHKGRVHPNINQTKGDDGGTGTGRLSYTQPALQQIPSRDKETAAMVRPIFLPEEGHGWTYGDLDQHELRIFHHYVNNPLIVNSYRENPNLDGHQIVADLTNLPRNAPKSGGANAKQINLGMVFNMGGGELADKMGLPFTWENFKDGRGEIHEYKKAGPEAQAIMDQYYAMVPGVKEIASRARTIAKSRGYVKTLMGRHIRFPGGMFTHKASGLVYQGTSADLNKDNIIRLSEYLQSECPEGRFLLNVHDEYSISLPLDCDWKKHCTQMRDVIQHRPEIRVPLRIDFSELAPNWWEATKAPTVK